MEINGVVIEDTFAEGFPIKMARVTVTAITERWAKEAAREATGFGTSVIGCSAEAGIECVLSGDETPDGRPGVNMLICNMGYKNLENSLLFRLSQCILTAPTAAAFSEMPRAEKQFDTGKKLSFFGDGYQRQAEMFGRSVWKIPLMSGDFVIENSFGAVDGIAGGNFLILAQNQAAGLTAAEAAVDAMGAFKKDYGEPLGVTPNLLVVGPSNHSKAKKIIEAQLINGGDSNTNYKAVDLLKVPWLA